MHGYQPAIDEAQKKTTQDRPDASTADRSSQTVF
jgi:hypothetical protein